MFACVINRSLGDQSQCDSLGRITKCHDVKTLCKQNLQTQLLKESRLER